MFCLLVSQGKTNAEAYRIARNKNDLPNPSKHAARWLRQQHIKDRIQELKWANTNIVHSRMAESEIDKVYIVKNLKEIVERCMQRVLVVDDSGKPVIVVTKSGELRAVFRFDAKSAISALHDLGLEVGMFREVKDLNINLQRYEKMSPEERAAAEKLLDEELARIEAEAGGGRVIEHQPDSAQYEPVRAAKSTTLQEMTQQPVDNSKH